MRETVCAHCGAVFPAASDEAVCLRCGHNPQKPPLQKLMWAAFDNYGLAVSIIWLLIVFRPLGGDLQEKAVLLVLFGAAALAMLYARRMRTKAAVPEMNLHARAPKSFDSVWAPPPPPRVTSEWSGLLSAVRPRQVFWPLRSLAWTVIQVVFVIGSAVYLYHMFRNGSIPGWQRTGLGTPFFLVITLISDIFFVTQIYKEFGNRHLLRDGDVTIGSLVDVLGRKEMAVAVYRFWTSSGDIFEHRGRLLRGGKEAFSAPGVVPVFYFPQEPSKSLALCSTALRVQSPVTM